MNSTEQTEAERRSRSPIRPLRGLAEAAWSASSLKARLFRGGVWLGTGSLAEQTVRLVRNMLLARILVPDAFGTMAIVLSAASVLQACTEIGVREALIHDPEGSRREFVDTAWWLAITRAAAFYSLVFLAAPWIARFYGAPDLTAYLRVAVLGTLFEGAMSTKAYIALKEMRYLHWAAINHGSGICGVAITLLLSLLMRNVWALVIGTCAEGVVRCALSYVICPYCPSRHWDRNALKKLLSFSRGVFGLSILNLIFARADIFVLAKLFPAGELGLYVMAMNLIQTPTNFLMNLLGQLLMPTFAHLQADNQRLNQVLFRVTSIIVLFGMPIVVFVCFYGRSVLTVIYGKRYAEAGAPLIVAACVALINLANGQITTVFIAKGRPHLHRVCVAVMAAIVGLLIYPLANWLGFLGAQVASLTALLAGFVVQIVYIRRLTVFRLANYWKTFSLSAAASISIVLVNLGARPFAVLARTLPQIGLGCVGCSMAFGIVGWVLVYHDHLHLRKGI